MSAWISVKEKLPEKDGLVLVFAKSEDPRKPLICQAWFNPSNSNWSLLPEIWVDAITHWMYLPEPPKE